MSVYTQATRTAEFLDHNDIMGGWRSLALCELRCIHTAQLGFAKSRDVPLPSIAKVECCFTLCLPTPRFPGPSNLDVPMPCICHCLLSSIGLPKTLLKSELPIPAFCKLRLPMSRPRTSTQFLNIGLFMALGDDYDSCIVSP